MPLVKFPSHPLQRSYPKNEYKRVIVCSTALPFHILGLIAGKRGLLVLGIGQHERRVCTRLISCSLALGDNL